MFAIVKDDKIEVINKYPRRDIKEPLEGSDDVEIYKLIDDIPEYDHVTHKVQTTIIELTPNLYQDIKHLKIAVRHHEKIELPDDEKILNFDSKFFLWLDIEYPVVLRTKHLSELNTNPTDERKAYIQSMIDWEWLQRNKRDEKLLNKDYTFDFESIK